MRGHVATLRFLKTCKVVGGHHKRQASREILAKHSELEPHCCVGKETERLRQSDDLEPGKNERLAIAQGPRRKSVLKARGEIQEERLPGEGSNSLCHYSTTHWIMFASPPLVMSIGTACLAMSGCGSVGSAN